MDIQHSHTPKGGMFYIGDPAAPTAEMVYRMEGEHTMIIDHTEVDDIHKGEGIGKLLVTKAVDYARQHQIMIRPACSFARSIFKKTKEYEDVYIPYIKEA